MPLIPDVLEIELFRLFTIVDEKGRSLDGTGPDASDKAKRLAQIIDTYIKTATVTIPPGAAITTTAGPGTIVTPMTGTLS